MTAQERQQLSDLLERAIRGDEQAISEVCEFLDKHRRAEIVNRLLRAGVERSVDQAYQQVLLTVQLKLFQLRVVDAFESWLWRLEMSVARKYRPRYAWYARSRQVEPQPSERPREIGTKIIVVEGKPQIARIFEPLAPERQSFHKRPLFETVTDAILAKVSMSNRSDYPREIDVWQALEKLPDRWLAIQLVYFDGYSRTETAKIMGCKRTRIFKLLQNAKNRLRGSLAGYDRNGEVETESRSSKARRRARSKRALSVSALIRTVRPPRARMGGFRGTAKSGA